LDFQDPRLAKFIAKPLTELNTFGIGAAENNDGFGYVCFNNLNVINKSKDSAQVWWSANLLDWKRKHRNPNGLYHVRACSFGAKDKIGDQFSHPFTLDSLILMHNGTLSFRYQAAPDKKLLDDLIDNKQIDSYNFLKTLAVYVEQSPPLKAIHINKAIKNWTGSFAFMIMDKRNPTKVFIVKDSDKILHTCIFKVGRTNVGFIINTQSFELEYAAELLVDYAAALNTKLSYEITKLDDLKIWEYTIGNFASLKEIEPLVLPILHTQQNVIQRGGTGLVVSNRKYVTSISYERVAKYSEELGLAYIEILLLSELLFKESFFTFDNEMMNHFADFLEYLSNNNNFKGRKKFWLESLVKHTRMEYYSKTGIKFPFFLNSKKILKSETLKFTFRDTAMVH